jgi:hypothetical protein
MQGSASTDPCRVGCQLLLWELQSGAPHSIAGLLTERGLSTLRCVEACRTCWATKSALGAGLRAGWVPTDVIRGCARTGAAPCNVAVRPDNGD